MTKFKCQYCSDTRSLNYQKTLKIATTKNISGLITFESSRDSFSNESKTCFMPKKLEWLHGHMDH